MKTRGAAVQGALAAVGLVAAYTTWQREPEKAAGEAVVIDAGRRDVGLIRYDDGKGWVELSRRDDTVWMKVSARPEGKIPERTVRGNESALKLWEKFAPLRASRALGALSAEKLKEFGLDAPKKKIEVTVKGQKRVLAVGTSPFGVSDPYVKDDQEGKVYVLGGAVLSDLDGAANRLMDRTVHEFKAGEFDGIAVSAGGKKRELVVVGGEGNPLGAKLASKATPSKSDETAKNWHDKVWRLYVTDVLGKDEKPANGEPQIAVRLDYSWKGKSVGFAEVGRVAAPAPANTSAPPPPAEVYARSEHSAGWLRVSGANLDDLLKESDKIAASE
jgi:Domain of unknown function (DUF4340)